MGQPVKLSDELVLDARLAGDALERSIAGQVEYWAKLGRGVEQLLQAPQVLALCRSASARPLSECLASVDSEAGRERVEAVLQSLPFPHFEPHPTEPGLLVRIEEDGRKTTGRFVNREFCATESSQGFQEMAPVDSREVVRCNICHCIQFRNSRNTCRSCKTSWDVPLQSSGMFAPIAPVTAEDAPQGMPLAAAIRCLRVRAGLSQRQLALRMNVPRAYLSKVETAKVCPTLDSLARIAGELHVRVSDLLDASMRAEESPGKAARESAPHPEARSRGARPIAARGR